MIKRIFLFAAAVFVLSGVETASAQSDGRRVQLGLRAGILSQDMELRSGEFKYTDSNNDEVTEHYATEGAVGFNVALVSRIRLTPLTNNRLEMGLFFQPEIIYSQSNFKMQRTEKLVGGAVVDDTNGKLSKIRFQSVEVPVLVGFKISILRANVGPVFTALFNTKTAQGDIRMRSVRPLVGWTAGLSVDIVAGLVLDGRYNGQFKQLKNTIKTPDTTYQTIHGSLSSWSVGLSYLF